MGLGRLRLVEYRFRSIDEQLLIVGVLHEPPQFRWKRQDGQQIGDHLTHELVSAQSAIPRLRRMQDEIPALQALFDRQVMGGRARRGERQRQQGGAAGTGLLLQGVHVSILRTKGLRSRRIGPDTTIACELRRPCDDGLVSGSAIRPDRIDAFRFREFIVFHRALVFLILASLASVARADRISDMGRAERCAYSTKLQVLAIHFYRQGKPRAEVKIHWHGDETDNEILFVNEALDAGYAVMQREVDAGAPEMPLELLGDRVFEACMQGQAL